MKILWFDSETTGLDAKLNDIITLAGILEIDGVIKERFDYKLRPFNPQNIEEQAMKVNGFTNEEVMAFPPAIEAKKALQTILSKYVDRFKKNKTMNDKILPAGQNVAFDVNFLGETWKKCGDNFLFAMLDYHKLDLFALTQILAVKGDLILPNLRLETVANHFEVAIKAHDALSDIEATREVFYKILNRIQYINPSEPIDIAQEHEPDDIINPLND